MTNSKIAELFIVEAEELITELEGGLISLEENPDNAEQINTIFRAAHTIKGSAGISGFPEVVNFAHILENVLEQVRNGTSPANPRLIGSCLKAVDILKTMLSLIQQRLPIVKIDGYNEVVAGLKKLIIVPSGSPGAVTAAQSTKNNAGSTAQRRVYQIVFKLDKYAFFTGQDPAMLIAELADIGKQLQVTADIGTLPAFDALAPTELYISYRILLETTAPMASIENVFLFVEDTAKIDIADITAHYRDGANLLDADKKIGEMLIEAGHLEPQALADALAAQSPVGEILVGQGKTSKKAVEDALARQKNAREVQSRSSIRVDTEKLDRLVNLVGELVTGVAQVTQLTHTYFAEKFGTSENDEMVSVVEFLDQVSRDLQEQVMVVRMVPVEATFTRFRRVVRDLAEELGKEVHLEMSGIETELDKNVIEKLVDPLKHLIRNAIDHGIEAPEKRVAMGKPRAGTLHLTAKQREGNILIEVEDDGQGIHGDKIRSKAVQKGLIAADTPLAPKDVYALLFEPGFSTAEAVTDVSGRGVGMDVVRRNIEALRGTIEIISEKGLGTRFCIRLPLTLAIIEGMNVKVGKETLTIPLLSIIEQMRPGPADLKTIEGKGELISVRGEVLPLIRLHQLFQFDAAQTNPCDALVIIMECDGGKYGLMVDDVLGQQQAVIKSLDKNFTHVDGVSGATILGDGSVSLILDPHRIEQMATRINTGASA
ncbi:MAG: chemotaxis protein CheA [Deltaproteobacteria bacterium]|nr:chemotaxis protein CheA [Deltaproteobacteria bacterium]